MSSSARQFEVTAEAFTMVEQQMRYHLPLSGQC